MDTRPVPIVAGEAQEPDEFLRTSPEVSNSLREFNNGVHFVYVLRRISSRSHQDCVVLQVRVACMAFESLTHVQEIANSDSNRNCEGVVTE